MSSYRAIVSALLLAIAGRGLALGAAAERELDGIKNKIASERKGLSQLQFQEGGLLKALAKIEAELDKKSKEVKSAEVQHGALVGAIARTEAELSQLHGSISQRQDWFRQRAQALYRWHRGGDHFWIVDGAGDLSAAQRRSRYLRATLDFDRGLLGDLRGQSRRQEELRRQLGDQQGQLAKQHKLLLSARAAVAQEGEKKTALLSALRQEKERRLIGLRNMEAAARRLQNMLDELTRRPIAKPAPTPRLPSAGRGLDGLQGQLDWPIRGPVSAPFGAVKHAEFGTDLVRRGIDIDAPVGATVRVVEKGRVVHADRFAGYGRMVIVDHGQRYYTVYAHLSEIVIKTGEELGRGEILGKVGESASPGQAKLYFELRKDGRSVDPQLWLEK